MSASTSRDTVCSRIAEHLAQSVGTQRYRLWFDGSAILDYEDHDRMLRVAVPNRFVADWIGRHFQDHLKDAAKRELGNDVNLDVRVDPESFRLRDLAASEAFEPAAANIPGDASSAASSTLSEDGHSGTAGPAAIAPGTVAVFRRNAATAQAPLTIRAKPRAFVPLRHRLSDFIVGPSNQLSFNAANRLVEEDPAGYSPLFIHGACGLGKTHLLQGICRKMLDQRPDARVLYTTGEQFTNEFLEAVRNNRIEHFRKRVRKLDLLAVDDIHFIANKPATQQEFLHSFDAIEMSGARVALASDNHPKLIKQFSDALISRCIRGMVVEIRLPDLDTRTRIIRQLALRRGLDLMDSAVEDLAKRAVGSVREIEGILTKIQALSQLTQDQPQQPIGHALLHRLSATEIESAPRHTVRIETVLQNVTEQLQVQRAQLMGNGRHKQVVLARSLVIYLARHMTSMSYPEIAAALGRSHHSTVITASQRVDKQLLANEQATLPNGETLPLSELIERFKRSIHKV